MRTSQGMALILAACILAAPPALAADEEPMLGSKDSFWGSLGLQYRLRLEVRDNADLDFSERDTLLMGLQRARLHLDFNYSDWSRRSCSSRTPAPWATATRQPSTTATRTCTRPGPGSRSARSSPSRRAARCWSTETRDSSARSSGRTWAGCSTA